MLDGRSKRGKKKERIRKEGRKKVTDGTKTREKETESDLSVIRLTPEGCSWKRRLYALERRWATGAYDVHPLDRDECLGNEGEC